MDHSDSQRLRILETLFAAFNRHDADGVMACFSPSIVFDTAVGPEAFGRRLNGLAAVRAAFVATWTSMPDVAWQVQRHAVFGDRALSEWRFTATATQGQRIEVDGVDVFAFDGDRIVSKSAYRKERPLQAAG
jgi:ketosteroid isomerase-like protein